MQMTDRKRHFVWSVVVVFLIQLPLLLYNTGGMVGFLVQLGLFILSALIIGAIYLALIKIVHADRQIPIPWYASPVVWLGIPMVVFIFYVLVP